MKSYIFFCILFSYLSIQFVEYPVQLSLSLSGLYINCGILIKYYYPQFDYNDNDHRFFHKISGYLSTLILLIIFFTDYKNF